MLKRWPLVVLLACSMAFGQTTTYQPARPVPPNITLGFGVTTSWASQPHSGTDYVSPLGNLLPSIGPGGVIQPAGYTKPNAAAFGSIDPGGPGPAIWMKYTLATGEPIYVLYGHTATTWTDATTGIGSSSLFSFNCAYQVQWKTGDSIGGNVIIGHTAPYYLSTRPAPHLHVGVFKPNMSCGNAYCPPPSTGWGYSQIHLSTGDFIDPEQFFTNPAYVLSASTSLLTIGAPGDPGGNVLPFGSVDAIYQQVYANTLFGSSPVTITGVTFSRDAVASSGQNVITPAVYAFSFSTTARAVGGLDNVNLGSNVGPDSQTFYTGTLSGNPGASLSVTGTPFVYNPAAGNLLLTITQTGGVCCGGIFFDARNGTAGAAFSRATGYVGTSGYGLVTTFTFAH